MAKIEDLFKTVRRMVDAPDLPEESNKARDARYRNQEYIRKHFEDMKKKP